jgi:Ca-activated chloride channel family protein
MSSRTFAGILWASTENLIYLPVLIGIIGILIYALIRRRRIIAILAASRWSDLMVQAASPARSLLKTFLMIIGCSALFLALLQPQWDKKEEMVEQQGRDLFIGLDISRSMLAQDTPPNRLAFAKEKIKKLVKKLSCERVGLILFSGSTFVQCPLTTDYGAFFLFIDQIDAESISSGTTAIDAAIAQAIEAFKRGVERKNKLLVLFTDGEDFSSNLAQLKQEAVNTGMHIFTVGVGTADGAPIPLFDARGNQQGHQLDKNGKVVITRLNEGILYNLAQDSGGTYLRAQTDNDSEIDSLVRSVEQFEKERMDDKKISKFHEQYPYFVGMSFICFLLEWLL